MSVVLNIVDTCYVKWHATYVNNIVNLILVLICLTTSQYFSFLFLAMRSATLFTNRLHSLDMLPVVRNTAGGE